MKKIRLFLVIALGLLFMASCTLNQTSITKEVNDEIKEGEASYTVTFVNEDGDELLSITKRATNKIIAKELAIEAKEGYNISFKNLDGEEIDLSMVRETMTVVVSYVAKEYQLKFYSGGALIDNQSIDAFSKATFPTEFKVPTGHEFIGWSLSRDEFIEAKEDEFLMPPVNTNLYAFFAKKTYSITLLTDVQALNELENTKEYLFGERLGQYVPDALSEAIANLKDYTLLGWYLDEELTEPFKAVSMPAEDLVLYAKFEYPGVDFMVNGKVYHTAKGHPGDEVLFPQVPTVDGYTFEYWQDEDGAIVTELLFGDVARILTAVFSANEGGYKVEYYCQNLGQSYILRESKYFNSLTGEEVEAEILDYVGFTYDEEASQATAAGVVLADSSLVLKVYYARCSYELKYLVDGELYGEVLTLKYQQLIIDPTAPSKDGYTFTGWDKEIPAQMPAADLTFNAQFSANKYSVKFMVDGTIYDEQLLDFDSVIEYPASPEKLGYTFTSWDQTIEKVPTANVTINAQFAINSYEVAIIVEGETVYKETLEYNSTIDYPNDPEKEGYTFIGWNPNPAATPAADIVITAQFEINEYTVKFIVDGETYVEANLEYNAQIVYPAAPLKEGYTFTGWDQALEKVPAADVTINALFEINSYQVVFVVDNEVYFDETKEFNQTIEYPADPEKLGYTFTGWDPTLEKVPAADVTFTAQFEINEYTVKFIVDGEIYAEANLEYNAQIVYPAAPEKLGYTFTGWDFENMIVPAADVTITAQFEVNKYTVKFIVDGVTFNEYEAEFDWDVVYPSDPEKIGYTFTGWDQNPTKVPAADLTINAQFEVNKYTVKFIVDGVTISESQLEYLAEVIYPADPLKEGYTFTGWDFENMTVPAADVTITAQFEVNKYTVKFIVDGVTFNEYEAEFDWDVVYPSDPLKEGYTFTGWDQNPTKVPAADLTITAQFSLNTYSLTLNLDGGQLVNYASYEEASLDLLADFNAYSNQNYTKETLPLTAWGTKNTHTFFYSTVGSVKMSEKWAWLAQYLGTVGGSANRPGCNALLTYTNASSFNSANGNYIYEVDYEFKAFIKGIQFTGNANYPTSDYSKVELQEGFFTGYGIQKTTFTYLDELTLLNPEKTNYQFLGWYDNPNFSGEAITVVANQAGNLTLYAKYELSLFNITYIPESGLDNYIFGNIDRTVVTGASTNYYTNYIDYVYLFSKSNYLNATYSARIILEPVMDNLYHVKAVYLSGQAGEGKDSLNDGNIVVVCGEANSNYSSVSKIKVGDFALATITNLSGGVGSFDFYTEDEVLSLITHDTYKVNEEKELMTPSKQGYEFVGWYNNPTFSGEAIAKFEVGTTGDKILYAKWQVPAQIPDYTILWDANGGLIGDEAEGEINFNGQSDLSEIILPTPVKEGYNFLGWYDLEAEKYVTTIAYKDYLLEARWEKLVAYIGTTGYTTLKAAYTAATDGDVIELSDCVQTLDYVISKSLTFKGLGRDVTIINVVKDVVSIDAANVSFEKLSLVGPTAGYASCRMFNTTSKAQKLTFEDCILKNVNTFLRVDTANKLELKVLDSHIEGISQFFLWTTANVAKIDFIGNDVDGATCGATPNSAAAFMRIRSANTVVNVYNNRFAGTHKNTNDGYFENGADGVVFNVMFNTFDNCARIVHDNGGRLITFDKNLYLDASGNALDATPAAVLKTGVIGDATLAKSEEERAQYYQYYLDSLNENVLNLSKTGVSGTTYTSWSFGAYNGHSAGGNSSIQLRTDKSSSGIVSTESFGRIKKIVITFNTATTTARKVDIYGSNTPYTAPTNLYNNSTKGTLIGSATYDGINTTYTIIVSGDYEYIGIRSNSGALYLSRIEICHGDADPVQQYSISVTGLEHATMDTIPTVVDDGTNISFGIIPDEGYEVSSVKANDEILTLTNNKYHFTVTKDTLIEITIVEKEEQEAETHIYTYTFTQSIYKGNGIQTLNGIKWTLNNNGGYYGHNDTKGQQIGSSNNPATTLTLVTSEISGTIKSIKIQTSGASGIACTLSVTVGGTQFGDSISLTSTNTEYTFTGSAIGEISFNFAQTTAKAIYIKAIEIEYEA